MSGKTCKRYSVIVVGAGHAGCEAALASARLGADTLLVTMNLSAVALMPCNPSIGGPGKGHLVREIGVLGGEMAKCIDNTCIQMKWLNTSKGPAVRSRRAQADKYLYRREMTKTLFSTPNLDVKQGQVVKVLTEKNKITGIVLETGLVYECKCLIVTTGTYLNSKIILGKYSWQSGPHNQRAAIGLSESLQEAGVKFRRLQTATPPRILKSSIDFSVMKELPGDIEAGGFLWEDRNKKYEKQKSCFLTFTDEKTVSAVKRNLKHSPLILENITNVGPKHCPSIDRKILKFPDQITHQIFVEPEGWQSEEMYLQGLTTGMPPEAQREIIASVKGLENAKILRYGYAIEYDALDVGLIRKTMQVRSVEGLYTAGQINGTSGYEEAAAQGLIAGINAVAYLNGKSAYWPSRTSSYIGVLVDDLSVWERPEPYRITPGHAEFRLTLRDDSAERRLTEEGYKIGLIEYERYKSIKKWIDNIENELERLKTIEIYPTIKMREKLKAENLGDLKKKVSALEILQRKGVSYKNLFEILELKQKPLLKAKDEIYCLETDVKYSGYAERERERIIQTKFFEQITLPVVLDKNIFKSLSDNAIKILSSSNYDDLGQVVRKKLLSKTEVAILLAYFTKDGQAKESGLDKVNEVADDK